MLVNPTNENIGFTPQATPVADPSPTLLETAKAAVQVAAPIYNRYEWLTRERFPADPNFDLPAVGREDITFLANPKAFINVKSQAQYDQVKARIEQEDANRQTLAASGAAGIAAQVAAGMLTPTTFIPFTAGGRGIRAVGEAMVLAAGGAAIDERTLLQNQLTTTNAEAAMSVGTSAILAGILGGAAAHLHAKARDRVINDMVGKPRETTISYAPEGQPSITFKNAEEFRTYIRDNLGHELTPEAEAVLKQVEDRDLLVRNASTAGAKATSEGDPGRLFAPNIVSRKVIDSLSFLNPVTRLANNIYSPAAREFIAKMDDAGLKFAMDAEGKVHAVGGTVIARQGEYQYYEAQFMRKLDDAFSRYVLGDKISGDQLQRAELAHVKSALARDPSKMDFEQFNEAVFLHSQTGEAHPEPAVNKAVAAFREYYDQFKALAEEAHQYRMDNYDPNANPVFDPNGNLGPDAEHYATHRFDQQKIDAAPQRFLDMLQANSQRILENEYANDLVKYRKKADELALAHEYTLLDAPQSRQAYANLEAQINDIKEQPEYSAWKDEELRLQRELRKAKAEGNVFAEEDLRTALKEHQKNVSDEVRNARLDIREAQKRQRMLSSSLGKMEETIAANLQKVQELEVQDLNALDTVLNAGRKLERALQKLDDKLLDANETKLYKQLGEAMRKSQQNYDRIVKLYKPGKSMKKEAAFDAYERAQVLSKRREKWDAEANKLIDKITNGEKFNRVQARETLRAIEDLNIKRVRDLNFRRAVREDKLLQEAEALRMDMTPEAVKARQDEAMRNMVEHEVNFDTKWREKGATGGNLTAGGADFTEAAQEAATQLAEKIRGGGPNISGLDIIGEKRGSELARMLNIPLEEKMQFLVTDVERLARIYARNLAPDIEIYRAFGSVNAGQMFKRAQEDFDRLVTKISSSSQRPASKANFNRWIEGQQLGTGVKMREWNEGEKEAAMVDMKHRQDKIIGDMEVILQRVRHQRGIPDDPSSFAYRAGKVMSDLNVARMMGSVLVSSLPDLARPVMRYGVRKTFRGTFMRAMDDFRSLNLSREEARRLGVALDPILHNRMQAMFDIWDDYGARRSMAERATGFIANKTGLVAGFDLWTAEMKQLTASVTMSEISNAVKRVSDGVATKAEREFLAENGIDERLARAIWDQHSMPGGGTDIKGVMFPNTEAWTNVEAKRAYSSALNRMVNTLIVTPSTDLPSWVDKNMATRLVAQFRSFTFASTTRVIMSGAQKVDMALLNGMAFSLALGAVSYYIGAAAVGGDKLKEAKNAKFDRLVDEAIDRSGLLGIFGEVRNVAQKIPATSPYASFSGYRTGTRRATSLFGDLAGPSVDLLETGIGVIAALDDPTQKTVHDVRRLLPYQNVFYLRQLFSNLVEEPVASFFPEKRGN